MNDDMDIFEDAAEELDDDEPTQVEERRYVFDECNIDLLILNRHYNIYFLVFCPQYKIGCGG